jgi:hypothetical protein
MKAEDLRIGNWVHQGDGFAMQIVAIFQDEVYLNFEGNEGDVWESKISDLHGFEWNTEWLENLGFKNYKQSPMWHKGNFTYRADQNLWYMPMEVLHPDLTKYVHQIQNLHQSLTGIKI